MIQDHVSYAIAAGAIPVPLVDIAAVTAVQLDAVRALARVYEVEFDPALGKALIVSIIGTSAGRCVASDALLTRTALATRPPRRLRWKELKLRSVVKDDERKGTDSICCDFEATHLSRCHPGPAAHELDRENVEGVSIACVTNE